jgi:hypothetical protein
MITDTDRQSIIDEEHLKLLPILYWIQGGIMAMYSPVWLIYIVLGVGIAQTPAPEGSPAAFGWMFAAIGAFLTLLFAGMGVITIMTGFWIRKRRHRVTCLVVAGISCLGVPYGTFTGVCTFMVLLRPSVRTLFDPSDVPAAPAPYVPTPERGGAA